MNNNSQTLQQQNLNIPFKNKRINEDKNTSMEIKKDNDSIKHIPLNINININQLPPRENQNESLSSKNEMKNMEKSKNTKDLDEEIKKLKILIQNKVIHKEKDDIEIDGNDGKLNLETESKDEKSSQNKLIKEIDKAISEIEKLEKNVNLSKKSIKSISKNKFQNNKIHKNRNRKIDRYAEKYKIKEGLDLDNNDYNNYSNISFNSQNNENEEFGDMVFLQKENKKKNTIKQPDNNSLKADIVKFLNDNIK